jgi:hypothetical protein
MRSGSIVGKMLRLRTTEPRVKSTVLEVTELGNVQTLAPQQDRKQWVHPPGQQLSFRGWSFASGAARSVHAASSLQHSSSTRSVATPMLAPIGSENTANAKTRRRWMVLCTADILSFVRPNKSARWMLTRVALAIKSGSSGRVGGPGSCQVIGRCDRSVRPFRSLQGRVQTGCPIAGSHADRAKALSPSG